ncbi:PilZ domain-containing protein [Sphingomonas sp. HDW15A]|uniref:PilZ domain-containing protein n=1 Tax=Sphingomonas sp. HDW15A TaxID=2714942 RepID=UPI0019D02ECC|nr:PilZ domain-containing protein [Sphingomonas sp. HDW15A]
MEDLSLETTSISLDDEAPSPSDRRDGKRHLTLFRVGAMTIEGRRELCLIKNISAGGMQIRPYCTLCEGAPLIIELKTGMAVPGKVSWIEGSSAGIEFDRPVDVLDVLAPSDSGPRPRMPRVQIDCYATVRDGANIHRLRVCDVSQGGVKLQGNVSLDPSSDLAVTLPGLPAQAAALRWSSEGYIGLTFNKLLALPDLVEWLRAIRDESKAA